MKLRCDSVRQCDTCDNKKVDAGICVPTCQLPTAGYQRGYQAGTGIQGSGIQCGIQEIGKRQSQHRVRGSQYAALVRKPVRNKLHQNATGWELVREFNISRRLLYAILARRRSVPA